MQKIENMFTLDICKTYENDTYPAGKYWSPGRPEDVPYERPQDVP